MVTWLLLGTSECCTLNNWSTTGDVPFWFRDVHVCQQQPTTYIVVTVQHAIPTCTSTRLLLAPLISRVLHLLLSAYKHGVSFVSLTITIGMYMTSRETVLCLHWVDHTWNTSTPPRLIILLAKSTVLVIAVEGCSCKPLVAKLCSILCKLLQVPSFNGWK